MSRVKCMDTGMVTAAAAALGFGPGPLMSSQPSSKSPAPSVLAPSDQKRPDPDRGCHQPHQTPGERYLQRLVREILLFPGMQRYHPTRVVDVPGATTAAGGDRRAQGILERGAL